MNPESTHESTPSENTQPEQDQASETPAQTASSEAPAEPAVELDWSKLGLSQELLDLVYKAGYKQPTEIQAEAIPAALAGRDLIASARTGSGKTACFTLPMLEKIKGSRPGTKALILAPTREIALQTLATVELFGKPLGIESIALIGGINYRQDEEGLARYPHVIVGTPGRIADHVEKGNLWLDYIQFAILDEADRMLDMGFAAQLSQIMSTCNPDRQTLFFSATFAPPVEDLARRVMHDPVRIAVGKPMAAAQSVTQKLYWMSDNEKKRFLWRMFEKEKDATFIVFTRSKDQATNLWRSLHSAGIYDATYISSNKQQDQREAALAGFKSGKYRMLIATDVAARGIHVENVTYVVNYELPIEPEDYIHRIGRTGRKDQTGTAISLVSPGEKRLLVQIERLMKKEIPAENEMPSRDGGRGGDRDRGGRDRGGRNRGGRDRGGRGGGGRRDERRPEPRRDEPRRSEAQPQAESAPESVPEAAAAQQAQPQLQQQRQPQRPAQRPPQQGSRPPRPQQQRQAQPRRSEARGENDPYGHYDPNEPAPWERGSTVYDLPQAGGGGDEGETESQQAGGSERTDRDRGDRGGRGRRRRRGGRGRSGGGRGTPAPSGD